MKQNVFLLVLSILLIASCSSPESKNEQGACTFNLPMQQRDDSPDNFNKFFKFSHVISLETRDDCLIKAISKVLFYKKEIYILDKREKQILAFDERGKFLRSYTHRGSSPQEYVYLTDFSILNDTLYLIDGIQGKLLLYGMNDSFIGTEKIERTHAIHFFNKQRYASNRGLGLAERNSRHSYHSYAFYDNSKLVEEDVRFNRHLLGYSFTHGFGSNYFYTYNDSVFTLFPFNDTIYSIHASSGRLAPYLAIHIGTDRVNVSTGKAQIEVLRKVPPAVFAFYKWGNYHLFSYSYKGKSYNVLIRENDILFHGSFICDSNYLPIHTVAYDSDDEHELLLSVVQPFEIGFEKYANKNPVIKSLAAKVTADSNPILVFYKPLFQTLK